MDPKKLVCIIPARGGSKGIKHKNLQKINGCSLIGRTIRTYINSKYISDVYVSSDSDQILKESSLYGAKGILRPKNISSDTTSSEDVLVDFFGSKKNMPEICIFAQCTSPLITTDDIDKAITRFNDKKFDSLFSASKFKGFIWDDTSEKVTGINHNEKEQRKRRQDINTEIIENGGFYIFKVKEFMLNKNRFFGHIGHYLTENQMLEIDDKNELEYARFLLRNEKREPLNFKHLFLDFDGVLTDNKVLTFNDGTEQVSSSKEDSLALSIIKSLGNNAYILTSETNEVVQKRADKLKIEVFKGISNKRKMIEKIIENKGLERDQIVYVGNDLNDMGIFNSDIFCCCPSDSAEEIKQLANYISHQKGGNGAVRDVCETFFDFSAFKGNHK